MTQWISPILALACVVTFSHPVHAAPRCERVLVDSANVQFKEKKSWGQQIIDAELAKLNDFFVAKKGLSDTEKANAFMEADVRRSLFKLQMLSRMFEGRNEKFFAKQRAFFKLLEDATGRLDLAVSLRKTAEGLGDKQLTQAFQTKEDAARAEFIKVMKEEGLWDNSAELVKDLHRKFEDHGRWASGEKEREYLVAHIAEYAGDVHKAVKENKFDDPDIEKGLHELRRRLRWVTIEISALDGTVQVQPEGRLSDKVQVTFDKTLQERPDFLESKYIKTSTPLVDNPILIPKEKLALISDLVSIIGSKKDKAEMQIYIQEVIHSLHMPETKATALLAKLNSNLQVEHIDHQKMSREIQATLAENKLLKKFAESIAEMNRQKKNK